jgi:hypothetical protein
MHCSKEIHMPQDGATALANLECAIDQNRPERCHHAPAIDLHLASAAQRGFASLIDDRRRGERSPPSPPPLRSRMFAAPATTDRPRVHVGVAQSLEQMEAADRLVRKRYAWRGYRLEASGSQVPRITSAQARREITFLATVSQSMRGTVTLRLDGPEGLHAEATHPEAVRRARADGRRIGELTRLALAEDVDSRQVLAPMFALIYTVGRVVHGVTDVLIEVNPRHVAFYVRILGFVVAGEARFCDRVSAPSVLLHLAVETLESLLEWGTTHPEQARAMRFGT